MLLRPGAILLLTLLCCSGGNAQATEFFVAPDGNAAGDGSIENPWDLQTALDQPAAVRPGDTIWLRGGTYGAGGATVFDCRLNGTEAAPIVVRQYPGERATIDGGIKADSPQSSWLWLRGFEITNSSAVRTCGPNDRPAGIYGLARGLRIINLVIHDVGHPGIGFWSPVGDTGEVHGTLLWANGLYDTVTGAGTPADPWTRGSAIYTQNEVGTRYLTEVICFRNFTCGLKPYTQGGHIDGFHLEGNTSFDNGAANILCKSRSNPTRRLKILSNCAYRRAGDYGTTTELGNRDWPSDDIEVRGNYLVIGPNATGTLFIIWFRDVTVTRNVLVSRKIVARWESDVAETVQWDENTYYRSGASTQFIADGVNLDFAGWKAATGYDANTSFTETLPTGVRVFVRPNKYEPGRANITVYNWDQDDSVEVDLSAILVPGDRYEIRDAQNYFADPVVSGIYDGDPVSLPMDLTEVAQPVGDVHHIAGRFVHTAPEFAVFVLRRILEPYRLSLSEGWQLVSIPLRPQDPSPEAVFPPEVVAEVWAYDGQGGYRTPDRICVKKGYWVRATRPSTRTIVGMRPPDTSVSLTAGWNLIGIVGPDRDQPWQPLPADPTVTGIWRYEPPYQIPQDHCDEGRGYFVRASAEITLWPPD